MYYEVVVLEVYTTVCIADGPVRNDVSICHMPRRPPAIFTIAMNDIVFVDWIELPKAQPVVL
jgi:hypothetical protein